MNFSLLARAALGVGVLALTSACSVRDCGSNARYLQHTEATPLVVPEGVQLPPASPLYTIPAGGEGELVLSTEEVDRNGKTRVRCLSEPPRMQAEDLAES